MLYIDCAGPGLQTVSKQWHVGESRPGVPLTRPDIRLQADGDELYEILGKFTNLPRTQGRVQVWRGDFARFIWDNL